MYQLVYISTARGVLDSDLEMILAQSRSNNLRDGITGLLLYNGRRFLQALEGPRPMVEAAYERIRGDRRHRAPTMLSSKVVGVRQFGHWNMAFERGFESRTDIGLVETVDALIVGLSDLNIRALFSSYVRLQSAA